MSKKKKKKKRPAKKRRRFKALIKVLVQLLWLLVEILLTKLIG